MSERRKKKAKNASSSSSSYPSDRLSQLPDCLLSSILSLLPLKDATRTSLLSSRWRRLWTLSPISLDTPSLKPDPPPKRSGRVRKVSRNLLDEKTWRLCAIDTILSHHCGPVHRLHASDLPSRTVDRLLEALTPRGLQEFSIYSFGFGEEERFYTLPLCLVQCPTLQMLELRRCRFPELPPAGIRFTSLRKLMLDCTILSDDTFSNILSNCRLLETLQLDSWPERRVAICSPNLRCLKVNEEMYGNIKEIVIEDAPNLEWLLLGEGMTECVIIKVRHARKLKRLGFVNAYIKRFELGETSLELKETIISETQIGTMSSKYETLIRLGPLVHSLKRLSIQVNFDDDHQSNIVSGLLKCFPCLETLDVLICDMSLQYANNCEFSWALQGPYDCLDLHLKKVTMKEFVGSKRDLCFAKFLLAKAQVLETMILICGCKWSRRWEETKRHQLCLDNKASSVLKVGLMSPAQYYCSHEFLDCI